MDSLAAHLPDRSPALSRTVTLAQRRSQSGRPDRLAPAPRRTGQTVASLRSNAAPPRSRAAVLAAQTTASLSGPVEPLEAAAERTGQAVADAVVASFERLLPRLVARALADAERRLMMAIQGAP